MNPHIKKIQEDIESLRQQIINHKVYAVINNLDDLNVFMKYHVFAVWDFMSLLKALQINLTCTTIPWFPVGSADTRFLINEIVVGEESDVDQLGKRKSHFEIYLDAMKQSDADYSCIDMFIKKLQQTKDIQISFEKANVPAAAQKFVEYTFEVINSGKAHLQAAAFTFGREDLIPGMFHSIINDIDKKFPDSISTFKYYLERHIEVDGGHHSHLALEMMDNLCCTDEDYWNEAKTVTINSLQKRIELWDAVYEEITSVKESFPVAISI
ncbi:MAG: DUF3050 domain-containing protein [Bacteroidota bacterium]